jgi:hypothetical protein
MHYCGDYTLITDPADNPSPSPPLSTISATNFSLDFSSRHVRWGKIGKGFEEVFLVSGTNLTASS